jgi:hypothetical protein
MRCDDPQNYGGGANAPSVMSTLSLQKVTSYVGTDTQGYVAYSYQLNYTDWYFTVGNPARNNYECADPTTNPPLEEYCAGEHLLTQVTPTVYQGGAGHTLKPVVFHYDPQINTYSDRTNPVPGGLVYYVAMQRWYLDGYLDSDTGVGDVPTGQ